MNKPLTKKEWEQSVASAWSTAVEATYKDMIAKAVKAERETVLQTIEALYNTQDPNPMYQEGYNHALDNLKEFVKARGQE